MCCHYPTSFFWDRYVIFDDNITIYYHTYEPDNLDYYPHRPFYIKRIDERITITLDELINFKQITYWQLEVNCPFIVNRELTTFENCR